MCLKNQFQTLWILMWHMKFTTCVSIFTFIPMIITREEKNYLGLASKPCRLSSSCRNANAAAILSGLYSISFTFRRMSRPSRGLDETVTRNIEVQIIKVRQDWCNILVWCNYSSNKKNSRKSLQKIINLILYTINRLFFLSNFKALSYKHK